MTNKADIKARFLAEHARGGVSKETAAALVEVLKNDKPQGRPTKAARDLKAAAWFHVATEKAGWKPGHAYQQLAKNLCTVERNARKIVNSKAAKADRIIISWKAESGDFIVLDVMVSIKKLPHAEVLFNGQVHRTYRHFSVKEGKNAFFYLFDKSEFGTVKKHFDNSRPPA